MIGSAPVTRLLIPLLAAVALLLDAPATAQSKEAMHARMLDLARQMDAMKPGLASNPANAYAWSLLLDEYRGMSRAMGGDDPAKAIASGFSAPSTPAGSTPPVPLGCESVFMTFSNNTLVAIPTGPAVVTSTILVANAGPYLWDLDLVTTITHTFPADLDITLMSPSGTVVTLTTDNGGAFDDVFNGTLWDDHANPAGQVPYVTNNGLAADHAYANGTLASPLAPEEALGAFRGENPNGTWTITVSDDLAGDGGALLAWQLQFRIMPRAPALGSGYAQFDENVPVVIPPGPAVVTSTVSTGFAIRACDVRVVLNLDHSFAADLDITLQSPSGTIATLTTDNGGANDNVWNGTLWNDQANPAGQVPYVTNNGLATDHAYVNLTAATALVPEEGMSAFQGEPVNGQWTLTISDDLAGDGGTLHAWTVYAIACACLETSGPRRADVRASGGPSNVNGVFEPGEQIIFEPRVRNAGPAFWEDFDRLYEPGIPTSWTATLQTGQASDLPWRTNSAASASPSLAALAADPAHVTDNTLDTPAWGVVHANRLLDFTHSMDMEDGFDGGVVEVSLNGGPFADIIAAGGIFLVNGYTDPISSCCSSPIGGRQAFSGNSGGFLRTIVILPASMAGQNAVFRFRAATDTSIADAGWRVDDVVLGGLNSAAVLAQISIFNGPAGASYSFPDGAADYGVIPPGAANGCFEATGNCYEIAVSNSPRPILHWDATLDEFFHGVFDDYPVHIGASFTDVALASPYYRFIETLLHHGVTSGCTLSDFCPSSAVLREQMAVFLLVARNGAGYTPPPCVAPMFGDVPCSSPYAAFVNALVSAGITSGCGGGNFCASSPVLREQMAVFLLLTLAGSGYVPPACTTPMFGDVPCASPYSRFVNELARRGITTGCGGGNFCPSGPVTREQMAVFLTVTFSMQLY